MQVTLHVPETLPEDVLEKFIQQFEARLVEEAQHITKSTAHPSKWAHIAQEAHDASPLHGLSAYVLECSQEIRDDFAFHHDRDEA